jgi:hypothetical protein
MKRNMGTLDRIVRLAVAAAIVALYLGDQITGLAAIILGVIAAALLFTSLIGWCPGYAPFGLSTCGRDGCDNQTPNAEPGH